MITDKHNALSAYSQVQARFTRLGIDLPPALVKAIATIRANAQRAVTTLDELPPASTRIAHALLTKADPLEDEQVRRDAAALAITSARPTVGRALEAETDRAARDAIRKALPALVTALDDEAGRRSEHIAAARAAVPDVDLLTDTAPSVPSKHLTTWAVAREAVHAMVDVAQAWTTIHEAAGEAITQRDRALIVADVETSTLDRYERMSGDSATRVAADGHSLSVPTLSEYRARSARVAADRAAEQKAREQAREQSTFKSLSLFGS